MEIPVYALTGFLDAGKTTFLNTLLNRQDWKDVNILVIQFESGEEDFRSQNHNCYSISFPKKTLDQHPMQVVEQIQELLQTYDFDEIWMEWNGVVPFSTLQAMLLQEPLRSLCKLQKVIHVADGAGIEGLLGRTGGALPEQIAGSDFALVRNVHTRADRKRISRLLNGINPGIEIYETEDYEDLYRPLFRRRERPVNLFFLIIVLLTVLHFVTRPVFEA